MISSERISLRPVTDQDDSFLLSVYASTRVAELAQVPWSPEQKEAFVRMQFTAQKQHYAAEHPQADHDLICVAGVPVGRIYIARAVDVLNILDITVLPEHRNAGIGSFLLGLVIDEARSSGRSITIFVENFNPSLRLFERLGFRKDKEHGFQLLLKWSPSR
ncbi:MAG TPA: GNAT family N-acetyltransferase [Candidatus Angelobacter sp.]|jgi:ribosomal protein S18 acetylase RimI-like enzyme|nr:GNAT family N-acetyltransferase [Candidatus Angelobacter sp.]